MIRVDARGMRCPWPALRAARAMRAGDVVDVLADDPAAGRELAALAAQAGWTMRVETAQHFVLLRDGNQGFTDN